MNLYCVKCSKFTSKNEIVEKSNLNLSVLTVFFKKLKLLIKKN